jgi:hypothetical protein
MQLYRINELIGLMYLLTQTEFNLEAEPVLRKIFVNDDAFNEPFSSNVSARRIVYPCCQYIEPPLIDAIVAAASKLGDTGCYLYDLWAGKDRPSYCYIPFSKFFEAYLGAGNSDEFIGRKLGISLNLENVLYSPSGKWGIMISHERHGLLGGSVEFIEEISQAIPDLNRQVYDFIEERLRREGKRPFSPVVLRWLPGLLIHVYGQTTAEQIMQEVGINRRYSKKEEKT